MIRWRRAGILCLTAIWATSAAAEPRINHEYVPPPEQQEAYRWAQQDRLPDHIQLEDRILPRPEVGPESAPNPRILDAASSQRARRVGADRETQPEGVLDYVADFNPTVLPFKRMNAFDRLHDDLTLGVSDTALRALPRVRRPTPPDRDAFWGSVTLRLEPGVAVPLPSVAPEAAIVDYQTEPPAELSFLRDGADNHWVSADRGGLIKLVWLTDAPKRYFAARIPPLVTITDLPPGLRPRLSAAARRQARTVLSHIGVRPGPLRRQLDRVVSYFRNFQAGELPNTRGNSPYLDLALAQRGVCRHRSYAFTITVQALGVPARYVHNEAHAFAEVFVPRSGWIRVDLGGASSGVEVSRGRDKTLHRPEGPDPFPRPSRFTANYSQHRGLIRGLGELQGAASDQARRAGRAGRATTARPGAGSQAIERPAPLTYGTTAAGAIGGGHPATAPLEAALSVHTERVSAYRGETLQVWGSARNADRGVGGLRIEIHLSAPDAQRWILVGATATAADGTFRAAVAVPKHLPVGDYLVRVTSPQTYGLPSPSAN